MVDIETPIASASSRCVFATSSPISRPDSPPEQTNRATRAPPVAYDRDEIRENTTYAQPHQLSGGMRHVIVNGVHTLANGEARGKHGGRFLAE